MQRANKLSCPSCGATMKSARGIRIGKLVTCLKCGVAFTARAADDARAGINGGRLSVVVAGALLYVLGGAGLAYYCFAGNAGTEQTVQVESERTPDTDDAGALPLPSQRAEPPRGAVTAGEQRDIDRAIARGAWFLRDRQAPAGHWAGSHPLGLTSLAGLTLLECGVPGDDASVQKAAAFVRGQSAQGGGDTYQTALGLLFLDRLGDKKDEELLQFLSLCLIVAQRLPEGAWHYACPPVDRKAVPDLLAALADQQLSLEAWHKRAGQLHRNGWDNSNTQFALLGLWVARRHGVAIDKSVAAADKHFRTTQRPADPNPDHQGGGWHYNVSDRNTPWPSMTCAGLLGLAIAHGVAEGKNTNPLDDPDIQRALAVLAHAIDHPKHRHAIDLYFLWSLERVGVLYNLREIGGKDWYAWGRKLLLPRQQADGSWQAGGYPGNSNLVDTCLALLFLQRANLVRDLTDKFQLLAAAPALRAKD